MEKALARFPDAPWDWRLVSSNPSVSFEFVRDNPQLPWIPAYVSENGSVTEKHVRANKEFPWDFSRLCVNPNMSFAFFDEFIIRPMEVRHVDWYAISAHPAVDMATVMKYPSYAWNDRHLSANPNLTSNFILNEGCARDWFVPFVCSNPGITARDIFKSTLTAHKAFAWSYRNLSFNTNLPVVFVNDHLDYDWNFHSISARASMADINQYQQVPWDAHGLSQNPGITFEFVKARSSSDGNGCVDWDVPSLLMNPAMKLSTIESRRSWFLRAWTHSSAPESFVSSNPTITLDWIKANRLTVDWKRLSRNPMNS